MPPVLLRLSIAILPLVLTPLWGYLLAEGVLNFGGGDKDLLLLIPWIAWSLLYAMVFGVTWYRGTPVRMGILFAALWSTAGLALVWAVLFLLSTGWFGISANV